MTFQVSRTAVSLIALCCSSAVIAGEEPLYEPAPAWIEPVVLAEVERDPTNRQIVNDTQIRIENGLNWEYTDVVYRVASLSDLSNVGTLTAQWLPDKGDLIVHEISIVRGDEVIDLVEQGEVMEVLRRERMLERRILDGSLTATLSVPGLEVGDELRMRYSVTNSDQALGEEVQTQRFLWREPDTVADFARVRASWPDDLDVRYKAGPNFQLPQVEQSGGHNWLEVTLPLEEADEFPNDAPLRYRRGTILQLGTFADWAEVSSTMAPYYETDGAMDGLDDLLAKVEAIRAEHTGDLEQAVAALELVQEDIRYLLNGLDGGNYLPQDVATTWENKYGDCKAKTVILLAILDHLGIEAEPVLVSSRAGNTVPISLPIPGAFDHVLVRAEIGGNLYYLDGTSLGANMYTVGNVPPFEYSLPIRSAGATIEPIEQVLPRVPELQMDIAVDTSAGLDLPSLVTFEMKFWGAAAAQMNAEAEKLDDERRKQIGSRFGGEMALLDVDIISGEDDSEATLLMTGISENLFDFNGAKGEVDATIAAEQITFAPNRSRKEWRDLPVSVGASSSAAYSMTMTLPDDFDGYELVGSDPIDVEVAGQRYTRQTSLDDRVFQVSEIVTTKGGEVLPEAFREERRKAASLARQETKLTTSDEVPRRWRFARGADRSVLAPLEAAYAELIDKDPDDKDPYLRRAGFRYVTYDFAGSLEDMNKVIELEATAEYYGQRSSVHSQLLDLEANKADLEEAYSLDPTPWRAIDLASAMMDLGDYSGAREIIEYEDGDEDVRQSLTVALAELDAVEGRASEGLATINEMLADDPNDSGLLNEVCWFSGTWNVAVSDGISVCTKAVENSGESANILDSRALIYLRNGMFDKAMVDIDAALELEPDQTASVLLRGLIRLEQGDNGGQADVDDALAREPMLAVRYRRWGFDL